MVLIFPEERPVFLREVNNNMYSVTAYFFGKVIAEIPSSLINPLIYGVVVYFAVHLSNVHSYTFVLSMVILVITYWCGNAVGMVISCIFSNKQVAVVMAPAAIIPLMLMCGYFVN